MINDETLMQAAEYIAHFCRKHICTECPLNIGKSNGSILEARCVCDYNILHLPSTWKVEELKHGK